MGDLNVIKMNMGKCNEKDHPLESMEELKKQDRQEALTQWLSHTCDLPATALEVMQGDASFRRYFRLRTQDQSFVVMDAPPPQENCRPFVAIANALRDAGLQAPNIIQADVERGFLLLTDFGDATYLKTLNTENADPLYRRALKTLAQLQHCREVKGVHIPPFTSDFMMKEWMWHKEWFLEKLLGLSFAREEKELDVCYARVVAEAVSQPQVFMHRDYHSANLMVLPDGGVGMLDFQDAFIGPITYDLVSLLRDCYIDWPESQVNDWVLAYWEMLQPFHIAGLSDQQTFLRWFDWMGIQRHLKALLTFARKHVRDQQSQYLTFIPRTLHYLLQVSARYPELSALHHYLDTQVQPAFNKVKHLCAQ